MKKTISYDDLMCVCELAHLFLENRNYPVMWKEEEKVVTDLKWYVLQCNTDSFTIDCEIEH